jgi:hypothetical protein
VPRKVTLAAVMVGALGIRLWGINFGLPAIYRPDEDVVVGRAMGVLHGTFDPNFADWPHLYMYVSAGWLGLLQPAFGWLGAAAPYLGVRVLDALLGTATVAAAYASGNRAYGRATGLISAVFVAVAFLAVRDSHFATTDMPLAFAVTIALYAALRLVELDTIRRRVLGGALLGLAAGVKYNGALALAGFGAAEVWQQRRRPRVLILALLTIGGVSALAFVLTSPFLLIDQAAFRSSLGHIFEHLSAGNLREIGYVHLPWLLWYSLDPPLFLLAVGGLAYAAVRRTAADWILLAFVVAYYALIGSGHTVFARYADPLGPPLVVLAARLLTDASARLRRPAAALALGVAIVAIPAVAHDLAYDQLITRTDTRTQALDWMMARLPAGSYVATLYFPGVAHDEAMIDSGAHSHGAPNRYVASFLQNRLQDRFRIYDLAEAQVLKDAISTLRSSGVDFVVYSATKPVNSCAPPQPLQQALDAQAILLASFSPTDGRCTDAVFDQIDSYFVPLSGYGGWVRPGPVIRIYSLRVSPRLFASR